jgi:hypothetical protein
MSNGIISQLLDAEKIEAEIKRVTDAAIGLRIKIDETADSAVKLYNALKQASDIGGLRKATSELNKELERKSALDAEQEKMLKVLTALEDQLTTIQKAATTEAKQRVSVLKEEKQHQDTVTAALEKYGIAVKNNENSIKALTKQNKELRAIVSSLNMDEQKDEIERLNNIINENTKRIKENRDAYTQQKMTIGDYKTAISDVLVRVGNAQALLVKLADEGKNNTKEYAAAAAAITNLNEELKSYKEGLNNAVTDSDTLGSELKELTNEMTKLNAVGRDNWTDEQRERFVKLSKEVVELKRTISNTKKEIDILASNNLTFNAIIESATIATAAFETYTGIIALAGVEDEKFKEIIVQLHGAMAVLNGLETISERLRSRSILITKLQILEESKYIITRKFATVAQHALNAAQKAMPILAIIAALALLVGWIAKYARGSNSAAMQQKELNDAMKEANREINETRSKFEAYSKILTRANLPVVAMNKALEGLNEALKENGKEFKNVADAQEWLIKNSTKYLAALKKEADATALMNLYQKKREEYYEKSGGIEFGKHSQKVQEELIALDKQAAKYLVAYTKAMGENAVMMDNLGLSTSDASDGFNKLKKTLDDNAKTEIKKAGQVYSEKLALIQANAKDEAEYNKYKALAEKEYHEEVAQINRKAADEQKKIADALAQLRIDAMKEGRDKELAVLKAAMEKEKTAVIGSAAQREAQLALIDDAYRTKRAAVNKKYDEEDLQAWADTWQRKADLAEKGSMEEYNARASLLDLLRRMDVEAAAETDASVNEINEYYENQRLAAYAEYVDARTDKAQQELETRLSIEQESAMAEEAALLEQYKKREINEKQYSEAIAEIRRRYSIQSIESEIDELKKLLDAADLTAEQRLALEQKLADAKKALSDDETEHTLDNIKKESDARKKALQQARQYAQQALDMTVEFLVQQSEAKVAEFDAELERIDELMNKRLEELDNAVMSDETRAAEEKRIRDEAAAQSMEVERKKREEQKRSFMIQQAQNVAETVMNTAAAIMGIWKDVPKFDFGASAFTLSAIVGALGAAQVAMILAQKPPKYAKGIYGDESHPGGPAIVGDAGRREYALTPAGTLFETPAVPTLVTIPKGTQVFPDYTALFKYMHPVPRLETQPAERYEFEKMEKSIVRAIEKNKTVQQVQMNLDNNGVWYVVNHKTGRRRHINTLIKGNA